MRLLVLLTATAAGAVICSTSPPASAAPDIVDCKGALAPSIPNGCQGVPNLGCCDVPGRNLWCQGGDLYCLDCTQGFQACGWNPLGYYDCGQAVGAADPTGTSPISCDGCDVSCAADNACSATCAGPCGSCATAGDICLEDGTCYTPQCAGKQCGTDPMGFSCGSCGPGTECVEGIFQCLAYPEGCAAKEDGAGCSDCACESCVCDKYPSCCSGQWDVFCATACKQECGMDCSPCPASPSCDGLGCGTYCGVDCGTCTAPAVCTDFQCCTPDCAGKTCGIDGCGGDCGTCAGFDQCVDGQCQTCVPACDGKVCGDDGCGGTCGSCTGAEVCVNGACETGFCAGQCGNDDPQNCGAGCMCYCNENCFQFGDCCDEVCNACPTLGGCCATDCNGKTCGDDGCGGSCGECDAGDTCKNGACELCVPDCTGLECGDDGCGGSCGDCAFGDGCVGGTCQGCDGDLTWIGCCEDGVNHWCQNGEPQSQACGDGCGWDFTASFYNCGYTIAEPTGEFPYSCSGSCTPSCGGKECGADNCGGTCGECASTHSCIDGACVEGNCEGITMQGCCANSSVQFCDEGVLQGYLCQLGSDCGWDAANDWYNCGFSGEDPSGVAKIDCCSAECTSKVCGDDGCGGSCGQCGASEECDGSGQCVPACVTDWCSDKDCGDDTCGGSCGTCATGWECKPNQLCRPTAACVPACDDKMCGDDGCGWVCGVCGPGTTCDSSNQCVETSCTPDCAGKACGSDGCWGYCGLCADGELCSLDACVPTNLCSTLPPGGRCDGPVAVTCKDNFIENYDCTRYDKVCVLDALNKAICVTPAQATPDIGPDTAVSEDTGGGVEPEGCSSAGGNGPPLGLLWVLLLSLVAVRRR